MTSSPMTLPTLKRTVLTGLGLLYAYDVYYIYNYVTDYYKDDHENYGDFDTKKKTDKQDEEILEQYRDDCRENVVGKAEYEAALEELKKELKDADPDAGLVGSPDDPTLKVMRESVLFHSGGRAAFLQLAHPFVAAGIRQHSNLENGISTRFYRTFKIMFALQFGTQEEMFRASRLARSLHDRVKGKIEEDVGIFGSDSRFDAAQRDAIKWVSATLLESAVFVYEMMVGPLALEEKDLLVVAARKQLKLFGIVVPPSNHIFDNWENFRKFSSAMWRSKLLTVSDNAKDTATFLLLPPPNTGLGPFLDLINYVSCVMMPPRLAKQFLGRTPSWFDYLLFSLFNAVIRSIYRWCPGDWRYLTAYHKMMDRFEANSSGENTSATMRLLKALKLLSLVKAIRHAIRTAAAKFTNVLLAMAMPDRDPEETRQKVAEKRKDRVRFEKLPDSPVVIRSVSKMDAGVTKFVV